MIAHASPHITMVQWTSGQKSDIDVFEDQLQGWLFEQARHLTPYKHAGPSILSLLCPYFEAYTCYESGVSSKNQSVAFLKRGLRAVFPSISLDVVDAFVDEVRHGFAHEAVFRRVIIHHDAQGLPGLGKTAQGLLAVDPWWLLDSVEQHFHDYVGELRSGADPNMLQCFNRFMTVRKSL